MGRGFGEQLELFARRVHVDALDPRAHVGPGTRVRALHRVRFDDEPRPHLIFTDRYGTYCQEHGQECPAVDEVNERAVGP